MRFLTFLGQLIRAAIVSVSKLILRVGNAIAGLPQPDFDPQFEESEDERLARIASEEAKAVFAASTARLDREDVDVDLGPRLSGWFSQLADRDVARLLIEDRERPGALSDHLSGKRPVFGVPPVGTATETANFVTQCELHRSIEEMTAAIRREQRRQAICDTAAPGVVEPTPGSNRTAQRPLDEPASGPTLH